MTAIHSVPIAQRGEIGLNEELDEAAVALAAFDAERLEAMEQRIRMLTVKQLRDARELLPEIREKHTLLGQILESTAANLKVLVSIVNLEPRMETR